MTDINPGLFGHSMHLVNECTYNVIRYSDKMENLRNKNRVYSTERHP